MTTIAIITIGDRDIQLRDSETLPAALQSASYRARTQAWLENWSEWAGRLSLPIVEPACVYFEEKQSVPQYFYLVCTDQTQAPPEMSGKDTIFAGRIIQRWLTERYRLAPENVNLLAVPNNPADFDLMLAFYRRELPKLRCAHPTAAPAYLLISGGTPAMTTMLILAGVDAFGAAAEPLYVSPYRRKPTALRVGRQILLDNLCRTLAANLDAYAYEAARATLAAQKELAGHKPHQRDLLLALLSYAAGRLNFDFAQAEQALMNVEQITPARHRDAVDALYINSDQRDDAWLLAEVYHGAAIKFETGAYADLLGRIFRFQDCLLYTSPSPRDS